MICPNCKTENNSNAFNCVSCNYGLAVRPKPTNSAISKSRFLGDDPPTRKPESGAGANLSLFQLPLPRRFRQAHCYHWYRFFPAGRSPAQRVYRCLLFFLRIGSILRSPNCRQRLFRLARHRPIHRHGMTQVRSNSL